MRSAATGSSICCHSVTVSPNRAVASAGRPWRSACQAIAIIVVATPLVSPNRR
jgi:hypothetical protein